VHNLEHKAFHCSPSFRGYDCLRLGSQFKINNIKSCLKFLAARFILFSFQIGHCVCLQSFILYSISVRFWGQICSFLLTVLVLNKLKGHLVVFHKSRSLYSSPTTLFTSSHSRSLPPLTHFSVCLSIYLFSITPYSPYPSGLPGAPFSLYHSLLLCFWPLSAVQPWPLSLLHIS